MIAVAVLVLLVTVVGFACLCVSIADLSDRRRPVQASPAPPADDHYVWSELDERQLTRLLRDSAP
jgi:hypothetical protein